MARPSLRLSWKAGVKVRAKVIDPQQEKDLQALVRENVEAGSSLYSDALKSYEASRKEESPSSHSTMR